MVIVIKAVVITFIILMGVITYFVYPYLMKGND